MDTNFDMNGSSYYGWEVTSCRVCMMKQGWPHDESVHLKYDRLWPGKFE